MTGSPLLDLFLAMALFYFALCMVCSSVNDAIARVLQWRAATLEDGIRSLLLNATVKRKRPDGSEADVELVNLFFNHPFVQTLRLQADLGDTWLSRQLDGLAGRLGNAWRAFVGPATPGPARPQLAPRTKLTFVPPEIFVHTLCEIIRPDGATGKEPLTFASLWRAIDQLPQATAGPLQLVLQSVAHDPSQDLEAVKARLAKWFNDGMQQATVWYRHKMRTVSLVVGAAVCVGLNIDSIEVANRFYRDANLRAVYAAAGERAGRSEEAEAAAPESPVSPIGDLRLGWQETDPRAIWDQLSRGMKLAGLVITVVAIGMGASFWHDVLTRLAARKGGDRPSGAP
jgi:hypothetical protein